MDLVLDIITGICFFVGSLSIIIGACGLIKLPDVFSRIHAAGMIDTGGTAFFSSWYDFPNRLVSNHS
jgi:multicomponent Na+:H+ antiporter subunit G